MTQILNRFSKINNFQAISLEVVNISVTLHVKVTLNFPNQWHFALIQHLILIK